MAGISPPGGQSSPTPPQKSTDNLARHLANETGKFVQQTHSILSSPHLADDPKTLGDYAQAILSLHEACGGRK